MKKKGVIAAVLIAAIGSGSVYGAYRYSQSSAKPVEVESVALLNSASYAYDYNMDSTLYGSIVTRSSQTVSLNTEQTLSKVYVSEGDTVKKGDKLLEYDMTLTSLQREMEDLNERLLEISLAQQQQDLETLKSGKIPDESDSSLDSLTDTSDSSWDVSGDTSGDEDSDTYTGSADVLTTDDTGTQDAAETQAQTDTQSSGEASGDGEVISAEDEGSGSLAVDETAGSDELTADTTQETGQLQTDADSDSGGSLIEDSGKSTVEEGENTGSFTEEGQVTPDSGDETESGDTGSELDTDLDAEFYDTIADFINRATAITTQDSQDVSADELNKILSDWQEISVTFGTEKVKDDPFGTSHVLVDYRLNDRILTLLDNGTLSQTNIDDLYRAFGIALRSNVFYWYYQVVPYGSDISSLSRDELLQASESIRQLYDAYYQYQEYTSMMSQAAGSGENDENALSLRDTLRVSYESASEINATGLGFQNDLDPVLSTLETTLLEESDETEAATDGESYDGDYYDEDSGVSAEELAEMISDKESEIEETQLQIRESKLEIKKYDRELEGQTVTAAVDGVVTKAGTVESGDTDSFIIVSGETGYYVKGEISESDLDTISVGDQLTGTSYDTGMTFTAEITEISIYPDDSDTSSMYYMGSSSNSSESQYSFYARIDGTDGIAEGDCEYSFITETSTSGIYLPDYMIRTDSVGRKYCYAQGDDGLLKKVFIKTGADVYSNTEVRSGLTEEDKIAFPYGRGVEEGAKTVEVEELSALADSDYYY